VWLSCLLAGTSAHAAAVDLHAATEEYDLSRSTEVLHDASGELTRDQALSQPGWSPLGTRSPVFGFAGGAHWFRTRVHLADHAEQRWVYLIPYSLLDHVDLHVIRADGSVEHRVSGDRLPFASRDLKHRHFNFLVDIARGESVELLLRVQTQSSVQVPQWLITRDAFFARTHEAQVGIGLYYGVLLALLLFNLIIYLSLRQPAYGWYVLYVLAFGVLQLNLNGLAFEYLWPDTPNWANQAMPLSMVFGMITMAMFARAFLDLKRHRPRLNRVFELFVLSQVVMIVGSLLLDYRRAIMIETASVFLITPLILYGAISLIRSGYRPASYFLMAWAALLLGVVSYAMVSFGLLPKIFITEYGILIGSALEMTLLSFALAFRIRDLEQEKQLLISRSRDELEACVEQRTSELNQALSELSAMNRQLHEVSRRDGLTGVYNRRFLEQSLDLLWESCAEAGEPFSVLMFDIDHFKSINDRFGHLAGDDCLRAVADVLHAQLRNPRECLARWGGEEFILLLPALPLAEARARAEQARRAIESREPPAQGPNVELRVSIGVASAFPTRGSQVTQLIEIADRALYRAKAAGRNRVEWA
jgi:diguanylate cyclase (GGDEF)-like protein